jgi:hypothetical protein
LGQVDIIEFNVFTHANVKSGIKVRPSGRMALLGTSDARNLTLYSLVV